MISTAMTIDGVIEVGDWYVGEGEHSRAAFDMLGSVDALLMGRKSYEGFKGYWPPIADDPEASPTHRGRGQDVRGRAAGVAGLLETGTWEGSDNVLLRYAARRESD
jgi:dihydrofolate reductase